MSVTLSSVLFSYLSQCDTGSDIGNVLYILNDAAKNGSLFAENLEKLIDVLETDDGALNINCMIDC